MKKNIIIAIFAIALILSIIYGQYEKAEAIKQERLAIENAKLAREMTLQVEKAMKLAQEQRDIAMAQYMEAIRQAQVANEALKKSNKAR